MLLHTGGLEGGRSISIFGSCGSPNLQLHLQDSEIWQSRKWTVEDPFSKVDPALARALWTNFLRERASRKSHHFYIPLMGKAVG